MTDDQGRNDEATEASEEFDPAGGEELVARLEELDEVDDLLLVDDRHERLDAAVEVAVHRSAEPMSTSG